MKDLITEALREDVVELQKLDPNKDRAVSFYESLQSTAANPIRPELGARVQELIDSRSRDFVDAFFAVPKEFWLFVSIMQPLLGLPDANPAYGATVDMLRGLGYTMVQADATCTYHLFIDYVLPKISAMLHSRPEKHERLLGLVFDFVAADARTHITLLKAVQEALGDTGGTFQLCLAVLISKEPELNDDLLDLYLYYAIQGKSAESASVRAASLSIIEFVSRGFPHLVLPMFIKLRAMSHDPWWEAQAQLLLISANLLSMLTVSSPEAADVYELVKAILGRSHSPLVRKIGCSCLAGVLLTHSHLDEIYKQTLMSLLEVDYSELLAYGTPLKAPSGIPGVQEPMLPSPVKALPPLLIAHGLVAKVKEAHLENLQMKHLIILQAILEDSPSMEDTKAWLDILESLRNFVYASLTDESVIDVACQVVMMFLKNIGAPAFETFPTLLASLKVLYPHGNEACRSRVLRLLFDIYKEGEPWSDGMVTLAKNIPDSFRATQLGEFCEAVLPKPQP